MMTNREKLKTVTRRQHYVWRHYLEAWAESNRTIRVLREGRSFAADPKNVMVQRDYYRVPQMTESDLTIVAGLTRTGNSVLDGMNLRLARQFAAIGRVSSVIQSLSGISDDDKRMAEATAIEAEENLHGAIEQEAVSMLAELREQDVDFLESSDDVAGFYHYLAQQYFRTKRRREPIARVLEEMSGDRSHLKNLVCHLMAVTVGGRLFRDRSGLEVLFLENATNSELVTGDQPIVNLLGRMARSRPPTWLCTIR